MQTTSHWLEVLSPTDSLDLLRDLARSHAEEAGPYRDELLRLIQNGSYLQLCEFEIDYTLQGVDASVVRHASQALAFFQKLRHLEIGVKKDEVGMRKFLEAERLCKDTNDRLRMRRDGKLAFPERVEAVFLTAQRKIRRVLKGVPTLDQLTLRFGPGSTRKTRKADASIRRKCAEGISCSEELISMVPTMLRELPHLSTENASLTRVDEDGDEWDTVDVDIMTSKLCFVAKNAKSYRLIGIEPMLNLMYQLGYGIVMAQRLAAFGIDIRDQTRNREWAKYGSLTGALATLDLSSASDTVSKEIVYELLPLDWACVLARGRSGEIESPLGDIIRQEKFSAMGNGYTFPLETLIFWALASSCCTNSSDVSVYGDDIIVPTEHAALVAEVLRYAGFNVNHEKSYTSGPFRESCGADYFGGVDVRPYFQKEWVSGQSLFVLHNWYVRHGDDSRAKYVVDKIHPALRIYGPDGYGDGHLIGDHQRRRSPAQHRSGYSGYFFESFTTKSRREVREDLSTRKGDFPAALYSIYLRGEPTQPKFMFWLRPDAKDDSFAEAIEGYLVAQGTPVPEGDDPAHKAWSLPGYDGYKKIKIYTLRG